MNPDGHYWTASGDFPETLTLSPSIHAMDPDPADPSKEITHWHGFLTNGELRSC